MKYREEDAEEMFQWLLRVNVFGYNDLEKEAISKLLTEIMLNKNIDLRKTQLEASK